MGRLSGMKYIVRADFYPSGEIIPLGITDNQGYSHYLKIVKMNKNVENGARNFECVSTSGKKFVLALSNNRWTIEEL